MGYTTDFMGSLQLSRELTTKEKEYINTFSDTRRMKRDVNKLMELYKGKHGIPDPADETPDSIYGTEGCFFAFDDGNSGQIDDNSILNYNTPPGQAICDNIKDFDKIWEENKTKAKHSLCQPGLWCQWIINEDNELEWDGSEKFYNYVEWLKYLIEIFFKRWGVKLNGEIEWEGEDSGDRGKIVVKDNVVKTLVGRITYEEE